MKKIRITSHLPLSLLLGRTNVTRWLAGKGNIMGLSNLLRGQRCISLVVLSPNDVLMFFHLLSLIPPIQMEPVTSLASRPSFLRDFSYPFCSRAIVGSQLEIFHVSYDNSVSWMLVIQMPVAFSNEKSMPRLLSKWSEWFKIYHIKVLLDASKYSMPCIHEVRSLLALYQTSLSCSILNHLKCKYSMYYDSLFLPQVSVSILIREEAIWAPLSFRVQIGKVE